MKLKERPAMPRTIARIKGEDLLRPKALQKQVTIDPEQVYSITIYTDNDRREQVEELERLADMISEEAKKNGITPKKLSEILGEDITEIL